MKEIKLNHNKFAIVDDEDFDFLNQYKWYFRRGYAARGEHIKGTKNKAIGFLMHRQIMMADKDQILDHINGNTLDNRKSNLRFCSRAQNKMNSRISKNNKSGYKGVGWHKDRNEWRARIMINKIPIFLGFFKDREKAALAYNKAAIKYHGEFANLNKGPF